MNFDETYIINPAYILKNDIHRVLITDSPNFESKFDVNHDFVSFIHPLHGMLLSFFDGNHNLKSAILNISSFLEVPEKQVEDLIFPYLENKNEINFEYNGTIFQLPKFTLIRKVKNIDYYTYKPEDFNIDSESLDFITQKLYLPLSAIFMINTNCYTNCVYCYADRTQNDKSISIERIKEIFREANEIGFKSFELIGGEIFLYPKWEELLTEHVRYGFKPKISTKIPISETTIRKLKGIGISEIQISLDSLQHDELENILQVGGGYIDKMKKTLADLVKEGFHVRVHTILTTLNSEIPKISSLIEYLMELKGIERLTFTAAGFSLYKSEKSYQRLKISKRKIDEIEDYIRSREAFKGFPIFFSSTYSKNDYLSDFEKKHKNFNNRAKCTGNLESLYILPDGKVTICEELYWNKNFIIGDLNEQSILEVWNSQKAKKLYHIERAMIQDESPCKECQYLKECREGDGVCWKEVIMAYGNDNWSFPDPRCPFAPEPQRVYWTE